jgi:competence protein ComEA
MGVKREIFMKETWLDKNRNIVVILVSVVAVIGAGLFYLQRPASTPIEIIPAQATTASAPTATPQPTATFTPAPLRVYVTGAVAKSDVYILAPGSIVKDAIQAAGGLTSEADPERINQALELKDQQQIHVPRKDEANPPPPIQGGQDNPTNNSNNPAPVQGDLININTATLEQLDTLPGIGPAIAQRIIDYRETVGAFASIEEITQVSGIGDATFAKIKTLITVE